MSDKQANAVRDLLLPFATREQANTIRTRSDVVDEWCTEHGIDKDDITIEQLLAIRALPEWKNAS